MSVANRSEQLSSDQHSVEAPHRALAEHPEDISCPPPGLYSDEPTLDTLHLQQMMMLIACLNWLWRDRDDYFAAGNLTIYYNENQLKSKDCRGPDFFVVLGADPGPRRNWVIWEEGGKYPNVIIELLSKSTAEIDRGLKKALYQDVFRCPEYFWFDPETLDFQGFQLVSGQYMALEANEQGRLWSKQLGLFLGVEGGKLRYFTAEGALVLTPEESAEAVRRQNERLVAKLRELGVEPDEI
ncbi:MAG: Uma2 family endonuclease [Elainellaceae cyanobacterium]